MSVGSFFEEYLGVVVFIFASFVACVIIWFIRTKSAFLTEADRKRQKLEEEFTPNFDPHRYQQVLRNNGELRLRQTGPNMNLHYNTPLPRPQYVQPKYQSAPPPVQTSHQVHHDHDSKQVHAATFNVPQGKSIEPQVNYPPPSSAYLHQHQLYPDPAASTSVAIESRKNLVALHQPIHPAPADPPRVAFTKAGGSLLPHPIKINCASPFPYAATTAAVAPPAPVVHSSDIQVPYELEKAHEKEKATNSSVIRRREHVPLIILKDLALSTIIGGGAFGQVWRGSWRGTPVAVKVLSSACQTAVPDQILKAFEDEVYILASLRHPNICLFMGACLEPTNRAIVTELVSRGSLWDVLRTPGIFDHNDGRIHHVGPAYWPWWAIRRVLDGTCKGLLYLHCNDPPIIHRDLKSANLLLDESFNVKICDFGLARLRDLSNSASPMTANVGTLQWMAPEVIAGRPYYESADMFSVGMITWELLTGKYPFEGLGQLEISKLVSEQNARPPVPAFCPPLLVEFLYRCWDADPRNRLTASQALERLAAVIPI